MADNFLLGNIVSLMVPLGVVAGMILGMNAFFRWVHRAYNRNFGA